VQAGEPAANAQAAAQDPMIGYLLDGRYELLKAIGSGGMSIVYQARLNSVGKMVAIKTLNIQVQAKDNVRERFYREIELLLKLEHPHIVSVQDCLLGPNDQPYLVMDLLRGVTLEQELENCGPFPAERVRKIMIQVCAAVKYAHQHEVVHRDLKPGNIMLLENEADFVKVLDFGLAVIGENNHKITQAGEFWGSPPYASPEQVRGDEIDPRSDIYSLGCVMYELLCGKDPFNGYGLFDMLSKHVNDMPEPLSVTNPNVSVPPELEKIVFKCLAKSPQDRYQTVAELQSLLETMNSGANVVAEAPKRSTISSLRKEEIQQFYAPQVKAPSYKTPVIVAVVLVLCVCFVFAITLLGHAPKTAATSVPPVVQPAPVEKVNEPKTVKVETPESKPVAPVKKTAPPVEPQPVATKPKPVVEKAVAHIHKTESSGHVAKVSHSKPAAPVGAAKHEPKQTQSGHSDPFATLKQHMSDGAKKESD